VALEPAWSTLLFAILSLLLLAANVDTVRRIGEANRVTRSAGLLINEVVTTVLSLTLIVLPWILGGLHPSREDLTWAILLAFAAGFLSICATVLSAFDVARSEASDGDEP
jgi:drug/metabolite transporter (DMT)-like permease